MNYKSSQALGEAFRETVEIAMDEVYDRLLKHLLVLIERDVYEGVDNDPEFYERTYDLMNPQNWEIRKWKYRGQIHRDLYFKGENLSKPNARTISYTYEGQDIFHDPSNYIHGNPFRTLKSETFLEILNNDRPQGKAFGFPQVKRKPFWDDFTTYCDRYYYRLLKNALQRRGMVIQ